jgi:hypothetical protein
MAIDNDALGLGVVLAAADVGAIWKAANLRTDVYQNYKDRVALAQAGLDERASTELRRLAERVTQALGDLERFNPDQALGDPGALQSHIEVVSSTMIARRKLPTYFRRMLNCGPVLLAILILLLVSLLIALSYFSGWKRARDVGYVTLWTSVGLAGSATLVTAYYFSLLHRFGSAEILSNE